MRLFTRPTSETPAVVAECVRTWRGGGRETNHPSSVRNEISMTTVATITACDQWAEDAEASQAAPGIEVNEVFAGRGVSKWCAYGTFAGAALSSADMRSEARHVTLRHHPGVLDRAGDSIRPAHASVSIRQGIGDIEPRIHVERWAARDNKFELIAGSWYRFSLDEAEELMNVLALAVAAAREGTLTVEFRPTQDSVDLDALKAGERP